MGEGQLLSQGRSRRLPRYLVSAPAIRWEKDSCSAKEEVDVDKYQHSITRKINHNVAWYFQRHISRALCSRITSEYPVYLIDNTGTCNPFSVCVKDPTTVYVGQFVQYIYNQLTGQELPLCTLNLIYNACSVVYTA